MGVDKANDLGEQTCEAANADAAAGDDAAWAALTQQIERIVDEEYDLGAVVRAERIFGGYCNASFAVWTRRADGEHKYFARKYNPAITEREVRFEHALLTYVADHGFELASQVFLTRGGSTFVTRDEVVDGDTKTLFFAVFTMLEGEDKYSWIKNRLTDRELDSGARVLAGFHHAAYGFQPDDLAREQPPIMEFARTWAESWKGLVAGGGDTACDRFLRERLSRILEVVAKGVDVESQLEGLPVNPVHCDYHPGNLKWVDEQGVGLFDFDWAKLDYRLFDVAQGIAYFCTSWEEPHRGRLRLDKAAVFARGYQDEAARWAEPGPMSARELAVLPRMIACANLYIFNWDITYLYGSPDPDVDEYLFYLTGNVSCMEYIEDHFDELAHIAESG
ncbi:MAG: phosphotransferase [Actinomycetes bacterium]